MTFDHARVRPITLIETTNEQSKYFTLQNTQIHRDTILKADVERVEYVCVSKSTCFLSIPMTDVVIAHRLPHFIS